MSKSRARLGTVLGGLIPLLAVRYIVEELTGDRGLPFLVSGALGLDYTY